MLQNLTVALPSIGEQTVIVKYVDQTCAAIDTAVERALHQIRLTKEYRLRLVADAVLGSIDVRDAAATLPETGTVSANPDVTDTVGTDADADLDELDTALEGFRA